MPKQKSHSGSKKRFWLTSTGKVKRPHGGKNHKAETKNRKRKRNLRQNTLVSTTQESTVEYDSLQGIKEDRINAYQKVCKRA